MLRLRIIALKKLSVYSKIFFSFFLAALMCITAYGAAIPAYAATSYEVVYITVDMLEAMYEAGDLTVSCIVSNTSATGARSVQYWDIISQTSGYIAAGESRTFESSRFDRPFSNQALIWFPYNIFITDGSSATQTTVSTVYSLSMPFDYYGRSDSEVSIMCFTPGPFTTSLNASLSIYDESDSLISSFTQTYTDFSSLPEGNPIYDIVASVDPLYQFVAPYRYNTCTFIMDSNDTLIKSLAFATSINSQGLVGSDNDTILGLGLYSFKVYVPGTPVDPDDPDSPSYADVVEEYLAAIVDIDNQTQFEIDALKAKLDAVDLDLNDISDQLVVQKPDISNGVSSIDTALLNGSEMFVTQSMTPILNQGIIVILFTGIFAIVSLKLVLFGSGKS